MVVCSQLVYEDYVLVLAESCRRGGETGCLAGGRGIDPLARSWRSASRRRRKCDAAQENFSDTPSPPSLSTNHQQHHIDSDSPATHTFRTTPANAAWPRRLPICLSLTRPERGSTATRVGLTGESDMADEAVAAPAPQAQAEQQQNNQEQVRRSAGAAVDRRRRRARLFVFAHTQNKPSSNRPHPIPPPPP